jgi:5-deoxy-glucuronate isomerase
MTVEHYLPAGTGASGVYDLVVTPASAGWGYSSLRTLTLTPGAGHEVRCDGEEIVVVPLSGGATVTTAGETFTLTGRPDVFAGPTDIVYLPAGSTATLTSTEGGRYALCGAVSEAALPAHYGAVSEVPVELRGAGQSSRQVRNFGTPESLAAGSIIACEVITPGGNWSSYPAHKHDETTATESELEEIYYFEIAAGPNGEPGLGFMRTSSSPGHDIDICEEVHDRDTVLVPYGWHGPCVAAPGYDMYYLNVMAGPPNPDGGERAWKISDHPDQTWVRGTWADQQVDPRLTRKDS